MVLNTTREEITTDLFSHSHQKNKSWSSNLFEDVIESFETDASWFLNSQLRNEKCRGKSDEGKGNRNSGEETGEEGAEKERPITFKRVQDPHISLSKR